MKKFFAFIVLLAVSILNLEAQTTLVSSITPASSTKYHAYKSSGEIIKLGGYEVRYGFTLGSPEGGLIADKIPSKAVFNLKGAYSKITLIAGPNTAGTLSNKSNSIVTITADGRRIFDEVIFGHDAPRFYTFDVTGVNEIVFSVPRGDLDYAFGKVNLWKYGESVSNTNKLLSRVQY